MTDKNISESEGNETAIRTFLSSNLICGCCLDVYNGPIMLPCSHCFCGECLVRLSRASRGIINCPICRVRCLHRSDLRKNFVLHTLINEAYPNHSKFNNAESRIRFSEIDDEPRTRRTVGNFPHNGGSSRATIIYIPHDYEDNFEDDDVMIVGRTHLNPDTFEEYVDLDEYDEYLDDDNNPDINIEHEDPGEYNDENDSNYDPDLENVEEDNIETQRYYSSLTPIVINDDDDPQDRIVIELD